MVLTYREILGKIENIPWFSRLGQGYDSYTRACSLKEAIAHWNSAKFEEVNSVAWEAFRRNIPKGNKLIWSRCFAESKASLIESLKVSPQAQNLLKCCHQEVEEFVLNLPYTGAIGESLAGNFELDFFTKQLSVYEAGHWVCGWDGPLYEDEFIYPKSDFIIF